MRTVTLTTALALSLLSACAVPPAPDGFLVVDDGMDTVKAIAPDESMFWVRSFDDPHQGTLDFWRETLRNDLVDHRGYVLLDEREVTWRGAAAVRFTCEVTSKGRARRYLVTFRIDEGTVGNEIHVAEFVADKAVFDQHVDAVVAALG